MKNVIHNVFTALYDPIYTEFPPEKTITQNDLQLAERKSVASFRLFERDTHKIESYNKFLDHCKEILDGLEEKPLPSIILSALKYNKISLLENKQVCDKLTQLFCYQFKFQDNPLDIAIMGHAFIGSPQAYAAFIRYLLIKGVTYEQLISTYLLHDYLSYYLISLSEPENSVKQLYTLLASFPETKELPMLAVSMRCEDLAFSAFSLDGSIHPEHKFFAPLPPRNVLVSRFTPTQENLNNLYAIFGTNYFFGVLSQWNIQKKTACWIEENERLFNHPCAILKQIPKLLVQIQHNASMKQSLAEILQEQTLTILIERRVISIFNLIPYHPHIAMAVKHNELIEYLQSARQQSLSTLSLITSLFELFDGIKTNNDKRVSDELFYALLEAILEEPTVIDDSSVLKKLRKFKHAKICITEKAHKVEEKLHDIIRLQTQKSIELMDVITIEDVWRYVSKTILNLQKIIEFESKGLIDKYQLYGRLAHSFFNHNKIPFNLDTFVAKLNIEPFLDDTQITTYERLLIELLITIDDCNLRTTCINELDSKLHRSWRTTLYGRSCLFKEAALAGNIGLIECIDTANINPPETYDSLAIDSANAKQWRIVSFFHNHHKLNKNTIKKLFNQACIQGDSLAISIFFGKENRHCILTQTDINNGFKAVVENKSLESVRYFLDSHQRPCATSLAQQFSLSIKLNKLEIAHIIAESIEHQCIKEATSQALMNAVRNRSCDIINLITNLNINLPDKITFEKALNQAVRDSKLEAVQCLAHLPIISLSATRIAWKEAIKQAKKHNQLSIVEYLATLFPYLQNEHTQRRRGHTSIAIEAKSNCVTSSVKSKSMQIPASETDKQTRVFLSASRITFPVEQAVEQHLSTALNIQLNQNGLFSRDKAKKDNLEFKHSHMKKTI